MLPKHPVVYREQNGPPGGAPPANPPAPPPALPIDPPAPPPADPPAPKTFDEDYVKTLRKEAADWRVKAQSATKANEETLRKIATSMGIEIPGGDPLDPSKLTEELSKTRRENLELKVGNALEQASRKHGADTELLVPYLRGSAALDKLDPASETFTKDVSDLVKNLVEKNPKLKAVQVASRSGGEFPGGTTNAVPQLTLEQVRAMKPEEVEEARHKGQLDTLLRGGKT